MTSDISYIIQYLSDLRVDDHQMLLSRHPESKSILIATGLPIGATIYDATRDGASVMLERVDEVPSHAIKKPYEY